MLVARRMGFGVLACAVAGLLLAVPPVLLTLYTTVSLGGYGEALVLGNLILLATMAIRDRHGGALACAGWGLLAGFSLWTFGLTLVYSIPSGVLLAADDLRRRGSRALLECGAAGFAGILLGALPMLAWGAAHGWRALFGELLGSAIAGASPASYPAAVVAHGVNLILFGPTVLLGLRPPWGVVALGMPVTPIVAALWTVAAFAGARRRAWPEPAGFGRALLGGVTIAVLAGFLLTSFGADPSGRYFLPLFAVLAITAAAGATWAAGRFGRLVYAGVVVVLVFNVWTNLQAAGSSDGMTTQFDSSTRYDHAYDEDLVRFLLEHGETRGYTTYWLAYPLAFLSDEQLVYLPRLPYHSDFRYTSRDDRYPPYRGQVTTSSHVAYVTAHQPWLDSALRNAFDRLGVGFAETEIGDFRVFHDLTRVVSPDDLGMGAESPE
jgi:hypothetical protein